MSLSRFEATTSSTHVYSVTNLKGGIVFEKLMTAVLVKVFSTSRETGRSITKFKSNQILEGMLSQINPFNILISNCIKANFKIISRLWL
jgi:hypothetical protein